MLQDRAQHARRGFLIVRAHDHHLVDVNALKTFHHGGHTGSRRDAGGLLDQVDDLLIPAWPLREAYRRAYLYDEVDPDFGHLTGRRLQLREHVQQMLRRL